MRLIERDTELRQLDELLADARSGCGCVVLVSGEAGAGKSALVSAFLADATTAAARVVAAGCDGVSVPRPLGPVIDIAAQLEVDVRQPRDELFAAVLASLAPVPTVLVLEDVHWADDATADFLLYVGRRVDSVPAMIIVTYRDDESGPNGPLHRLAGELVRMGGARRMPVSPLTSSGVAQLLADSDLDLEEVYHRTAGNAFFVTELIAAGATRSSTIRDVVLARAAKLSARGRRVADIAALLGGRFSLDLLAEVSATDREGIDDCIMSGLLILYGDELGFRHELTRATVADEIPPIRRATLNGAILRTLEARRDIDIGRLATHAALANEADAAYRYGCAAAEQAVELGSPGQAVQHLRNASRFASTRTAAERAALLDDLAAQCMVTDQLVEAASAADESVRLWTEVGDQIRLGAGHLALGQILWYLGQGENARANVMLAVSILEPHGPTVELARALGQLAALRMMAGNGAESIGIGQRALEIAATVGDAYTTSDALNTIGCALVATERVNEGMDQLERSLQVAREHDLGHAAGRAYANLGSLLAEQNSFERFDVVIAEGLRYTEDRELTLRVVCLTGILADSELQRGRWDDAVADALGVLERAGAVSIGQIPALTVIATIKMRRGEADAGACLRDALRRAQGMAEIQRIAPLAMALAEHCWLDDDVEGARMWLDTVHETAGQPDAYVLGQLGSWSTRLGGRPGQAPAGTPAPLVPEIEGRWADAALAWRAAGHPYEAALALVEVATAPALMQAYEMLARLAARPAQDLIARRLGLLGERVPRGGRASTRANPAGLTAREVEVLTLIADGLTNAGIASRLYISEKTAQHHVSRVLAKLDVPSRRDAARAARELRIVAATS